MLQHHLWGHTSAVNLKNSFYSAAYISEGSQIGTYLAYVSSSDADRGPNGDVKLSLWTQLFTTGGKQGEKWKSRFNFLLRYIHGPYRRERDDLNGEGTTTSVESSYTTQMPVQDCNSVTLKHKNCPSVPFDNPPGRDLFRMLKRSSKVFLLWIK